MYFFFGKTLKTCNLVPPLFLVGFSWQEVSSSPDSDIKYTTSLFDFFSVQFKLLHNYTFPKPGIIHKIIIQLHLISIRCNNVGEA